MDADAGRKPLPRGRGVLLFKDFCRSTGLDQVTIENLMRTELLGVSMWSDEQPARPVGIFDDALPSRESLAALGLPVSGDYDPEALRSTPYDGLNDDDIDAAADDSGPTWMMAW